MGSNNSKTDYEEEYERVVKTLIPGDMIEIKRFFGYKHWVLFHRRDEWDNYWCYHVTGPEDMLLSGKAILKYEPLKDILNGDTDVITSVCQVNNQTIKASILKYTIMTRKHDIKEVFKRLNYKIDSEVVYDLEVSLILIQYL